MEAAARARFCAGVAALLRALHPRGTTLDFGPALAEFARSLAVVDDPNSFDLEHRSMGSLTRADALRIRASKFVAANLPPGMFAELAVRRTISEAIRELTAAALGEVAQTSRYLDEGRGEDRGED